MAHQQPLDMIDVSTPCVSTSGGFGRKPRNRSRRFVQLLLLCASLPCWVGCTALHPLTGIPARRLSDEFRHPHRSAKEPIDPSLLRQTPTGEYRVDTNDVMGVYVEGVIGGADGVVPPVNLSQNADIRPALGYPVRVGEDGTIVLPGAGRIPVRGLTTEEIRARLRDVFVNRLGEWQKDSNNVILVDVLKKRTYRVLVVREEPVPVGIGQIQPTLDTQGRGTGRVVELPAYHNDVLNALVETGGMPGREAHAAVYVIRRRRMGPAPTADYSVPVKKRPTKSQYEDLDPQRQIEDAREPEIRRGYDVPMDAGPQTRRIPDLRSMQSNGPPIVTPAGPSAPEMTTPSVPSGRPSFIAPVGPAQPQGPSRIERAPLLQPNMQPASQPGGASDPLLWPQTGVVRRGEVIRAQSPEGNGRSSNRSQKTTPSLADRIRQMGGTVPTQPTDLQMLPVEEISAAVTAANAEWSDGHSSPWDHFGSTIDSPHIIKIPLRMYPGEPAAFCEQDILLEDGDVIYIESRSKEFFYTGGLLGGGQFTLPRDYDLDVLGAIALVQQRLTNANVGGATRSLGGVSALNRDVTISASKVVILRKTPDGGEIPIMVDLNRALRDPRERVNVLPGDYVFLQYTRMEAIAAFFDRRVLDNTILGAASTIFFNN